MNNYLVLFSIAFSTAGFGAMFYAYANENAKLVETAWYLLGISGVLGFMATGYLLVRILSVLLILRAVYEFYWRYIEDKVNKIWKEHRKK